MRSMKRARSRRSKYHALPNRHRDLPPECQVTECRVGHPTPRRLHRADEHRVWIGFDAGNAAMSIAVSSNVAGGTACFFGVSLAAPGFGFVGELLIVFAVGANSTIRMRPIFPDSRGCIVYSPVALVISKNATSGMIRCKSMIFNGFTASVKTYKIALNSAKNATVRRRNSSSGY